MITAFQVKNFKCFGDLSLKLGHLTLLTGFNGGGKSTAVQPLLLLAQNMRLSVAPETYALNGPLVQLGTVGDVLPSDMEGAATQFNLSGERADHFWSFSARAGDRFFRVATNESRSKDISAREEWTARKEILEKLSRLIYISAVREGTADAFPSPNTGDEQFSSIGVDGRFASYWYHQFVDNEVPEARRHPGEPAGTFRKQLDAWIGALFPGAQANVQSLPQVSMLCLQFRLSDIGPWRRPANIGYGLTYAFPILVALLAASDGQIIVVDSPEAHLHPSAQSEMGRILAHFAGAGVQIIVETHSDHLLNGARLAVKDGRLHHSLLQIHFFTGANSSGHGVISPTIDSEGRIYEWPSGFFDQSERDLSLLTGLE
jgi:predicted ATPase